MAEKKRILRNLKLRAIAAVDNPCQEHAKALIFKRADYQTPAEMASFVAKYICAEDGAHSFTEVLQENKFSEAIWPFTDALSQSIRSIVGDTDIGAAEREAQIKTSVEEFLTAVRGISPGVEKQLRELISNGESTMTKTVEQLEAEVTKLTSEKADLTSQLAKAKADMEAKETECDEAKKALAEKGDASAKLAEVSTELETVKAALAKATDETVKTADGTEIRKSVVGEGQFAMAKALVGEREQAVFEKRASTEYAHVAGTVTEKALLLKARESMSEDAQKALDTVLKAAEAMTKAGFSTIGTQLGEMPTVKAARATFSEKVAEIEKRDGVSRSVAMGKAQNEFPTEFAEAYPEVAAN